MNRLAKVFIFSMYTYFGFKAAVYAILANVPLFFTYGFAMLGYAFIIAKFYGGQKSE